MVDVVHLCIGAARMKTRVESCGFRIPCWVDGYECELGERCEARISHQSRSVFPCVSVQL